MDKKKVRRSIYVSEKNWDALSNYIGKSKSEWIDEQIEKLIDKLDDIDKIDFRISEIQYELKNLNIELEALQMDKKRIIEKRKENTNNWERINKAMDTIRRVAQSNINKEYPFGYIEKYRVEFVANNNVIEKKALISQIEKENIPIREIAVPNDETILGDKGSPSNRKA